MDGLRALPTQHLLEFAQSCSNLALEVGRIKLSPLAKAFGYKSFWKHLPVAMLCLELHVPESLSFREVGDLLRCADSARGRKKVRSSRGLQRQYERFIRHGVHRGELIRAISAVIVSKH